jgi:hypothetical protein
MVKVWFSEELQLKGSSLMVQNATGEQVDSRDVKLDPSDSEHKLLTVGLPASLVPGRYKVTWKSVSADDGDEDEGDFSFTLRAASAPAAAASPVAIVTPAAVAAAPVAQPLPPAPTPRPAAPPSPAPAAVQVPQALPRTGSAPSDVPWVWLGSGGLLLVLGVVTLRRARRT